MQILLRSTVTCTSELLFSRKGKTAEEIVYEVEQQIYRLKAEFD